ncbi:MAG: hypothetical protein CMC07_01420 [Flavobacteriaceae bacterium]|nr:hypothetical protein [Flavobacteriaceae bacterium]|tara:strand:- start:18559 stop:19074 length:516 start_codon:yes stop_codon:yes gene_type:complete
MPIEGGRLNAHKARQDDFRRRKDSRIQDDIIIKLKDNSKIDFKKLFTLFILVIIILSCSQKNCKLKNGLYKVTHNSEVWDNNFEFDIENGFATEIRGDMRVGDSINWISDNEVILPDVAGALDFEQNSKKFNYIYGKPYYHLKTCRNDTIYFELRRNDKNIIYSGTLIRKE